MTPQTARRPVARIVAALVLGVVVLGAGATQAGAQDNANKAIFRSYDTTNPQAARADIIVPGGADMAGVKVRVNGDEVQVVSAKALNPADDNAQIGFVVDTGTNMSSGDGLAATREALNRFIDKAPAEVQISIVAAGQKAARMVDYTSDKTALRTAVNELGTSPDGKSALYDAIRIAAAPFQNDHNVQPNVVIVAGDSDGTVETNPKAPISARGAVLGSGTTVFAAELTTFDPGAINTLVEEAGGMVRTAGDGAGLGTAIDTFATAMFEQQYRIEFNTGLQKGQIADVAIDIGGQTVEGSMTIPGVSRGLPQIVPKAAVGGGGLPLLDGSIGLFLVIGLTLVGATLMFYALTLLFVPDENLSSVLQPYADGYIGEDDEDGPRGSAIIQRAVELTEQVAQSQGYLSRTENALERANMPLRAGEALFAYLVVIVVATLIGLLLYRNLVVGVVFGVMGAMLPVGIINFMASRRRKKFMYQLPDTLQLLSGTLRAGYSLMQGIEAVSQEVEDPMGIELRRAVTEARLGRPVEEALEASAERMDSPDFAWAVMAIRIQREVGGNLSELLLTVAETMTARERLRRDVAALTAEGRMSAIVLGLLPPLLGVAMFVINPQYTGVLFTDGLGIAMLIGAVVAMLIGFAWMRKIINIEI